VFIKVDTTDLGGIGMVNLASCKAIVLDGDGNYLLYWAGEKPRVITDNAVKRAINGYLNENFIQVKHA